MFSNKMGGSWLLPLFSASLRVSWYCSQSFTKSTSRRVIVYKFSFIFTEQYLFATWRKLTCLIILIWSACSKRVTASCIISKLLAEKVLSFQSLISRNKVVAKSSISFLTLKSVSLELKSFRNLENSPLYLKAILFWDFSLQMRDFPFSK